MRKEADHVSKARISLGPLFLGSVLMKFGMMIVLICGLAACGGPKQDAPPRKEDSPVKTGVTISGEARVGITSGF